MGKRITRTGGIKPPGTFKPLPAVGYILAGDLHGLAAESNVKGHGFIVEPERSAARLNAALNLYIESNRLTQASPAEVTAWREALSRLADDLAATLGSDDHDDWVSHQLHLSPARVSDLRATLLSLSKTAGFTHDPGRRDWAKWSLFYQIAPAYEVMHGAPYTVSVSPASSKSSGPALKWTLALFRMAAAAPGAPDELQDLAAWGESKREGVATLIRDARADLTSRRQITERFYNLSDDPSPLRGDGP